ncbi:uncharacterized protein LOC129313785 [Prosopis cineraria]|uniref:uncharacterized protein LOC129313785 n=1 Tax=Prosopis cineraria TaxID=364024 RepID=UPI00240F6877|nr:uncharacterized protein LOC129313785 [Prosopis cineraria]
MSTVELNGEAEKLHSFAKNGKWSEVLKMYENYSHGELRRAKLTATGDTILHMAVSSGKVKEVEKMVDLVCGKRYDRANRSEPLLSVDENEKQLVLGAENDRKNNPLHLAASKGNAYKMCKKIGEADPSLIARRNIAGETPLFLAAFSGRKKAFLWLHYLYMDSHGVSSTDIAHCIRDDEDTILHCSIAQGHLDVALEIVRLYEKEMMLRRNKDGLSPLHLLATMPSAFESTDLLDRSFVSRLIYPWIFVEKKERATKKEEVASLREPALCVKVLMKALFECCRDHARSSPMAQCVWFPLMVLGLMFLYPLSSLESSLFSSETWLHEIRKMKEKHTWSVQIIEQILQNASNDEISTIITRAPSQRPSSSSKRKEDNEPVSIIVETPLMIAAKNGVIEMVDKILKKFPSTIKDVNDDEKKNIVLLAAEKRQIKVYQFLYENGNLDKSAFRQVDEDGNTALHLAAKLGVNLNWQTCTMIEEFKWFEFVKNSVPLDFWERHNNDGKIAEEIFGESYREQMTSDTEWLNKTSEACSVVSTLVASMAFSNVVDNFDKGNSNILINKFGFKAFPNLSLVALSFSLTSTIFFLAILASRSHSLTFWKYVPFMLFLGISFMLSSIVSLWISLMLHDHSSTTNYLILGSPIAVLVLVSLPIFIGPTIRSMFTKFPSPNRITTSAIRYRRTRKKEKGTDFSTPN